MESIKLVAFIFIQVVTQNWALLNLRYVCNSSEQIEIFNVVVIFL